MECLFWYIIGHDLNCLSLGSRIVQACNPIIVLIILFQMGEKEGKEIVQTPSNIGDSLPNPTTGKKRLSILRRCFDNKKGIAMISFIKGKAIDGRYA